MKQKLQHIFLIITCALAWTTQVWGYSNSGLTVSVEGGGLVAITSSNSAPSSDAYNSSASLEQGPHGLFQTYVEDTYYIWVKPNSGFQAVSMSGDFSGSTVKGSTGLYATVKITGKTQRVNKSAKITFKTTYTFSATATPNNSSYGTATASVNPSSVANTTATSASSTATFTASPKTGYEFQGWGTSSTATTYESTDNPYKPKITGVAGSTANKTLYAIFKPYFNFTVTANKINGGYGSVTKSVTAKVLGNPGDTSASTQATFTATPNTNCTFVGWYYDAEHTNLASTEATYKPNITNSTIGSTKNLTLYAWFKSNQTLTWSHAYEKNIVVFTTAVGAAAATASSELPVSYSSSDETFATVNASGDVYGVSTSSKDVTITARQAGNDAFNPVEETRSFRIIDKYQAEFEVTGFEGISPDTSTIYVGDEATIKVKYTDSEFSFDSSDKTVVGISKSNDIITLTALKTGVSIITLNQPNNSTHSPSSATYILKVIKYSNNLAVELDAQNVEVDGSIGVSFTGLTNEGTAIVGTVTDQSPSSSVNQGDEDNPQVISYSEGVITAVNAGTAKITFTQAPTNKYEGFTSQTYTITVTKVSNPIIVTLNGSSSTNIRMLYNSTATLAYSSAHSLTPINVTLVESTLQGGATSYSNGTITSHSSAGTDRYEITQTETYRYEAGYASFRVRVNNTSEEEGYVLNDASEHSWSTISKYIPAKLSGPGDVLSFDARRQTAGVNYFYVLYSTDDKEPNDKNKSWTELANPSLSTSYQNYSYELPDGVTYVKFETYTGATLSKYVRNIKVTRKTYVKASASTTAFGTVYTDSSKPTSTITVDYSTTNGGNISIDSDNSHFTLSTTELSVSSHSDGTKNFTVTYNPDPDDLGAESAVITIQDLFYTQQITLTATAAKHANTLAVIGEQNLMVGDEVGNVFSSKNSTATLNCTLSREGVIEFDTLTNKITAVGAGTVVLTISQEENKYYLSTSKTVEVTVSKYNQEIIWDVDFSEEDFTLEAGDVLDTNTAKASSGLAVTYTSQYPELLAVHASSGKLTAIAKGSYIAITARQAGNYMFNPASETRYFNVISREVPTVETSLTESGTNYFPIGNPSVVIRCHAAVDANALDVIKLTENEGDIVSVVYDKNTFTLTAVSEGQVSVTLTREETEDYYALSKTYIVEVVKPAVVLDPTVAPDFDYEEYSTITLRRTLKAGYSTIALPFDTSVEAIVGDDYDSDVDWVAQLSAVTNSVADGYTLYFQKVTGGVLEANEPYVLHLGSQVVNPTWTNYTSGISVEEAEATSVGASTGYSGYAGSNFTPNFPMAGKYGIVNSEGGLMLGSGENAKLNAFAAYITAPAGPSNAPLRVAYIDENGTTTYVGELIDGRLEAEPVAIYGPDGKRRSQMQRGVNIVRYADGTTKKVRY